MIAEKITSAVAALGALAGNIPEEQWELVACARNQLKDAAEQTEAMESHITMDMLNGFIEQHRQERAAQ